MKSYTGSRNFYGKLTLDTTSDNLTLGDELINDSIKDIIAEPNDWDFLEKTSTDVTVGDQQAYDLPAQFLKMDSVTITQGSSVWPIRQVSDRRRWDNLNVTTFTSDIPRFYFLFAKQIHYWPTPATSSNTITYDYLLKNEDLNIADYTTGTVDIITNDSAEVTGASTVWTTPMVGRWMRVTRSNVAAASGDHVWYEIASRTSDTVINLEKNYEGTSLVTGASAAYIIGQMSLLPEEYHNLPIYKAVEIYWSTRDLSRSAKYEGLYNNGLEKLKKDHGNRSNDMSVGDEDQEELINPNLLVSL